MRVVRVRRMLLSPELWAAEVACTQVQAASHWWCRNQCNVATTPLSQSIFFFEKTGDADRFACEFLQDNVQECLGQKECARQEHQGRVELGLPLPEGVAGSWQTEQP